MVAGYAGAAGRHVAHRLCAEVSGADNTYTHALPDPVAHAEGQGDVGNQPPAMLAIAEKVGYQSEASFGKAFKKYMGISPGACRRDQA